MHFFLKHLGDRVLLEEVFRQRLLFPLSSDMKILIEYDPQTTMFALLKDFFLWLLKPAWVSLLLKGPVGVDNPNGSGKKNNTRVQIEVSSSRFQELIKTSFIQDNIHTSSNANMWCTVVSSVFSYWGGVGWFQRIIKTSQYVENLIIFFFFPFIFKKGKKLIFQTRYLCWWHEFAYSFIVPHIISWDILPVLGFTYSKSVCIVPIWSNVSNVRQLDKYLPETKEEIFKLDRYQKLGP